MSGKAELAQEYEGIARGLSELGVVDAPLAGRLEMMAGYRNRLVHPYAQVTPQELQRVILANLGDLRDYVRMVDEWVEKDVLDGPACGPAHAPR